MERTNGNGRAKGPKKRGAFFAGQISLQSSKRRSPFPPHPPCLVPKLLTTTVLYLPITYCYLLILTYSK